MIDSCGTVHSHVTLGQHWSTPVSVHGLQTGLTQAVSDDPVEYRKTT